jgi:hypothetical protein
MASTASDSSCPNNHPISTDVPDLKTVLDLLQISEESVLCIYPYGSHLFNLAKPDSGTQLHPIVDFHSHDFFIPFLF